MTMLNASTYLLFFVLNFNFHPAVWAQSSSCIHRQAEVKKACQQIPAQTLTGKVDLREGSGVRIESLRQEVSRFADAESCSGKRSLYLASINLVTTYKAFCEERQTACRSTCTGQADKPQECERYAGMSTSFADQLSDLNRKLRGVDQDCVNDQKSQESDSVDGRN